MHAASAAPPYCSTALPCCSTQLVVPPYCTVLRAEAKKYAVILAFDVPVAKEARELSEEFGVKIFTADVIYHLFDQFTVGARRCF